MTLINGVNFMKAFSSFSLTVPQNKLECLTLATVLGPVMDKLQPTGQNLGRVFNFRNGHVHAMHLLCYGIKLPNLKLKTRPKQLLGFRYHASQPCRLNLSMTKEYLSETGPSKASLIIVSRQL
jgi:hypothetical protein